jgi:ABC-2 type transport system permease protein
MSTTVARPVSPRADPVPVPRQLWSQFRYANRNFWRNPFAAFFTLVFPLTFLVVLSAIYGNAVIDEETGLRLAQYTAPVFAVFATCMACYMSLAISLAYARQSGVLKRLRGTPLRPWVQLAGRVLSAVWVAALAVIIMIAVGVVFYDVQIIGANIPALLLTFVVGAACFTALGLAVAAVAPTPNAATAFANASLILLAFVSGIFGIGELPTWMDRIAAVFPLQPFVESFTDGFNPYIDASVPDWGNIAVMAAWLVVGILIARQGLTWEPSGGVLTRRGKRRAASPGAVAEAEAGLADANVPVPAVEPPGAAGPVTVIESGSPSGWGFALGQTRYALAQVVRDPMSVFFSVLFPLLLLSFFAVVSGDDAQWEGLPLAQYLAAAFAVYGVAVAAFVNLAGGIAEQRGQGVLKRLRGTPMPAWSYLVGRIASSLVVGLLTVVLVFGVGSAVFGVTLPPGRWLPTLLAFTLAIMCFASCGLALVSLVDGPQTVVAATLSLLLPLSFVSDIFIAVEEMPAVLNAIGWAFPLRHAVAAAVTATSGAALDGAFWGHLLVLAGWLAGAALVAVRWFHWEPRRSR